MVATLNQSPRRSDIANQSDPVCSAESFLHVSRLSDLNDDATINALRRAAEIRHTWSDEEVARRKTIGQQRRDQLAQLLAAVDN